MRSTCLAFGITALAVVCLWQAGTGQESGAKKARRPDAGDLLKHGDYLVNRALLCADCHTPQDDQGQPDRTRMLRGTTLPIQPKKEMKKWADKSPDITGSGLAGQWSEEQMVHFLETGADPDGMKARPPMPAFRLSARDARAVAVYLKSLGGPERAGAKERANQNPE